MHHSTRLTLVYDGDCAFCRRLIDRLKRMDRAGLLLPRPFQDDALYREFPALRQEDPASGVRVILPDNTILAGADACHAMIRRLPGWRRLAWLYQLPGVRPLAQRLYRIIASHRHTLGGTCSAASCCGSD